MDLNSTAIIEDDSSNGLSSWVVDGQECLSQQWFWVRLGQEGPEQSVEDIDPDGPQGIHSDNDLDPGNESLLLRYENSDLRIDVSLELIGGLPGSGQSYMKEFITIADIGGGVLDVHFFQYADFDLADSGNGDTVAISDSNAVTHIGSNGGVSEAIVALSADHREANVFSNTLAKLEDGLPTTLSGDAGPVGPGNVTWAFQWDLLLNPGESIMIRKYKQLLVSETSFPKDRGDVTEDGFVGSDDLVRILTNWGASGPAVTWDMGDCAPYNDGINTGDHFIGSDDYVEVLTFWGASYPPEPVPEPAALSLLLLATLASLNYRRLV